MSKALPTYRWTYKEPTTGQKLAGDIIFIVIGTAILLAVWSVIKFLFISPLRYMFTSEEKLVQIEKEKILKDAKKRYDKRVKLLEALNTEDNPMRQYWKRYITEQEKYKKDPKNKEYLEWYKDWKAGKVLDSYLLWAPDARDGDLVSMAYVNYIQLQVNLHKNASWKARHRFVEAMASDHISIRSFSDCASYAQSTRDGAEEQRVRRELLDEIKKAGISEYIAGYLLHKNLSGTEIRKHINRLKEFSSKGWSDNVIFQAEVDDSLTVDELETMDDFEKKGCNPIFMHYYMRGLITVDELIEVVEFVTICDNINKEVKLKKGDDYYRDPLEEGLEKIREIMEKKGQESRMREMEEKTGRATWNS